MDTERLVTALLRGDFQDVSVFDRRRLDERRIPCDPAPIWITPEGGRSAVKGYMVNTSRSGLGFRCCDSLAVGTTVTVHLERILILGSIRYCAESDEAAGFDVGLLIHDVLKPADLGRD